MSIRAVKLQEFSETATPHVVQSPGHTESRPLAFTSAGARAAGGTANFSAETTGPSARLIDPNHLETMLAKARGKGKADGFAEGVAMAEQRAESELRMLLQSIREKIADLDIQRHEVNGQINDGVGKICDALFKAIAPALAEAGLVSEINAAVSSALRQVPESSLLIVVSPDQSQRVAEALDLGTLPVRIDDDPDLGGLQARIHWQGGFDAIDLDTCIAEASTVLNAYLGAANNAVSSDDLDASNERKLINE